MARIRFAAAGYLFCCSLAAGPVTTIDFDTLSDGEVVTNQFPLVTFTGATVLTAGISLNEFEFPPKSGANVVFDAAPIEIVFTNPIFKFWAYFTYLGPIELSAKSVGGATVATATSIFDSNLAISGDLGSMPNELLELESLSGIKSVRIAGLPEGGSFVMDDVSFEAFAGRLDVPEPYSGTLVLLGLAGAFVRRRSRRT
jgi:hypothetical protein